MGYLVDYFQSLKANDEIDPCVLDVINNTDAKAASILGNAPIFRKYFISLDEGLCAAPHAYSYLPWREQYITYCSVNPGYDVLSRPFSGCYFAKVRYLNETSAAFHIHTNSQDNHSRKNEWNAYMNESDCIKEVTIFNPFEPSEDTNRDETWGIISQDNKCFAVFADPYFDVHNKRIQIVKCTFHCIKEVKRCGELI